MTLRPAPPSTCSVGRRRDRADDLRDCVTDVPESVRSLAVEIVPIAFLKHARLGPDSDLDRSPQHEAGLLGGVRERDAGFGTDPVGLPQHQDFSIRMVCAEHSIRDRLGIADLDQVLIRIERRAGHRLTDFAEEPDQRGAESVQHRRERVDARTGLVALDERDRRVGGTGARGELAHGQLAPGAQFSQMYAEDGHGSL